MADMTFPRFSGPLRVEATGTVAAQSGLPRYRVTEPLTLTVCASLGVTVAVTVPAGYVSDLASVPRLLRRWASPADPAWAAAAVVHDYLCANSDVVGRAVADRMYLVGALALGANPRAVWIHYALLKARSISLWITRRCGYYLPTTG